MRLMRICPLILVTVLLVGCESPQGSSEKATRIVTALERRITIEEAQHICFGDIDRAIQAAQTPSAAHDSRLELQVLSKQRKRQSAELDSFLSRSRSGDELWLYRTYVTADRRGGESGFALVRDGRVVEHMGLASNT